MGNGAVSDPRRPSGDPTAWTRFGRYLSCVRPGDVIALQGSPILGAVCASLEVTSHNLASLAVLAGANVLLVSHVFLLNDWAGLHADLADANKAARVFTTRGVKRAEMAILTAGILALSLVLFAMLGAVTLALASGIAVLSGLYSLPRFNWKGIPLLNSATHLAGGILHFLLGYSIANPIDARGVALATFFALVFAAGHLTQEVRDHEGDAASGIRTNAVVFGPRRAFVASLALFTMAHATLLALAVQGLLPHALAALVVLLAIQLFWSRQTLRQGLSFTSVSRLQSRYRALFAFIGVAVVVMSWLER